MIKSLAIVKTQFKNFRTKFAKIFNVIKSGDQISESKSKVTYVKKDDSRIFPIFFFSRKIIYLHFQSSLFFLSKKLDKQTVRVLQF